MRHLEWIVAALLVLAPMPCAAQAVAAAPTSQVSTQDRSPDAADVQAYAQREADALDLEEFAGGNGGLVLAIVLIAAVIVLIAVILPW